MEETADPLDISKEQDLVKDAQKELTKLDVLVCGGCHEVFHFVEEFQNHKTECSNISVLKCENEEKSQIWGFTLWKVKQMKTHRSKGEDLPTSWEIYQKWTKLEQVEKDLWISAGRMLQYAHKMSNVKIKDIKEIKDDKKVVEKDPLALDDGIDNSKSKTGLRTSKDNEKEEYNVEKIIGKKFNHRKRIWEYEVKWENYSEPTWEPVAHLANCKALVQEFEENLKIEKEMKEKDKPPGRGRGRPRLNTSASTPVKIMPKKPMLPTTAVLITSPDGGRPQRTSKQKALDQVKAWCGNISDEESGGGLKRPLDDDSGSEDSFERKIKHEGESDTEEEEEEEAPKPPVRKLAKIISYNNGIGKKLPDNVLIPDAKGVVRISQKQLPSLSSGVYIMSKSSGIIKLDPTASKIATSGGQAIVKVSPKIGQTQIKIIKKDDGSKRVVQVKAGEQGTATATTAALTPIVSKPVHRIVQQIVSRTPILKKITATPKKIEPPKPLPPKLPEKKEEPATPHDDESDDGIPELEFPTDLPLPVPESPPREFTLDPFTGKVAGVEYPDPEPQLTLKKEKKPLSSPQSLDNIVKLAAADITEEDLKPEPETHTAITTAISKVTVTTVAATVNASTLSITSTTTKANQSILNTAMVNSNILQKTLQAPSPRPKTQPRIINQAVAKPKTTISPVIRTPQRSAITPVRAKQVIPPKPKFNISPVTPVKNVYSAKTSNNIAKKVGNTTIYKARPQVVSQVVKKSPQKPPAKPISMPTLDEEPGVVLTPKVTQIVTEVPAVEPALSTFTLTTNDRPMFITGDDGTVYQVAGQNEEGQTILVTQDSDGQQQCLLVTSDALQDDIEQAESQAEVLMEVQEPEPAEVSEEQPLLAQFVRADPPSPGGTHRVVVMLDGELMVTQVSPEEYANFQVDSK